MAGACEGKVALVTGASRGLGKAIAQRLAAEGATVGITARTMEPDPKYHGSLQQTLDEIVTAGGSAVAIQADLSKPEDRERLFAELAGRAGAPDILVNNAAVTFLRPLDEFPERRARLDGRDARLGANAPGPAGDPGHARTGPRLDPQHHLGRRRPAGGPAVLRIRPRQPASGSTAR